MKILIAEDELNLQDVEKTYLETFGFNVDAVDNGLDAVSLAKTNAYDAIILDIMMPKLDGLEALKQIRANRDFTPILMLTAKAELDDKINGLDLGADDYLTKPFALKELLARIKSLTRRRIQYEPSVITFGKLTLDTENGTLSCVNSIALAFKETRIMELLINNSNKEVTKNEVYEKIWKNEQEADINQIEIYIHFLKNKLKAISANVDIEINGDTYRLVKND